MTSTVNTCSLLYLRPLVMSLDQILRIPRDDQEGDYVLLSVASGGPSVLDLKLLATEGESPYYVNRELRMRVSLVAADRRLMKYSQTVSRSEVSRQGRSTRGCAVGVAVTICPAPRALERRCRRLI